MVGGDIEISCTLHDVEGGVYNTQGGSSWTQNLAPDWSYSICTTTCETVKLPLPRDRPFIEPPPAMGGIGEICISTQ